MLRFNHRLNTWEACMEDAALRGAGWEAVTPDHARELWACGFTVSVMLTVA